ncbi:MAG TPA: replicative DNA helicase, partial [Elusimicrobiota bacterium]|nr:replicative DNA helicase [Elusimicrobiota bacterium]
MPTDSIHVPPQAIEAEMAVLGSMLIEREAVEKAIELLEEGMFYKDAHRKVFAAACSLYQRGQAVDIVTVGEELRRSKVIGEIGGPTYLAELQGKVATSAHIEHYARMVREKGILRELIRASTEVVTQCYREEKDPSELLDEAQARILAVAQKQTAAGFVEAKQIAHEVIEEIEKIHQRKAETTGVPTGFKELDRKTSGLQKGDLILLAARPGQGKTSLALNIATNIVLHPKEPRAVAFYSMEMSRNSIFTRIVSAEAGVALHELRNGYFRRDRWTDVTSAAARLSEAPLFINDMPGLSVLEVRSLARRLHSDLRAKGQSLGLVIIDYLQLMRGASRR